MKNTDYFKDKKVTIIGFARSGLACANLLYDLGAKVCVTDNKDSSPMRSNLAKLKSKKIKVELGRHSQEFIKNRDLLILSPGVPNDALPVIWSEEQFRIPIISEIEFAWILCPATVIAVTGSSGKTTVTTLIGQILEGSGKRVFVCGNIGNPFCGEVQKMQTGDFVSLEVSSFQLERTKDFKPKIAVILNFSRNHLDRYKNMEEYWEAKKRIFANQEKDDFLVLNRQDPLLSNIAKDARAKTVFFSQTQEFNPNHAAVAMVGSLLGIDKNICLKVFDAFKGLEHRMEYVAEIDKVKFINDSKSTLVESTVWAIKNTSSPIILIAGGKDKGLDYRGILEVASNKVKEVVLIGEAKEKIKSVLSPALSLDAAGSLEEAVGKAFSKARPGDSVLFSPMCSGFDMFSDYEERGNCFKRAVANLEQEQALA